MRGLRIFLSVCAVSAAFFAASLWRDRHNILEKYPEWKSAKTELALGVNGARSFTVTPISLLGGALNLGAWHGHQEVMLDVDWPEFPEVTFRIYVGGRAESSLIASSTSGLYGFALRLSSNELHPSAWLRMGEERAFMNKWTLDYRLPEYRWVEIALRSEQGKLAAYADGVKIGSTEQPKGSWRLAFRGVSSAGIAKVDELKLRSGMKSYEQTFSGNFPYWPALFLSVLLWGFIILLELMVGPGLAFAAALGVALFAAVGFWFYDTQMGNQYPGTVNLSGYVSNIESREQALARLRALPAGKPVLLWLGGSQAWGAGASATEKSVFGRLREEFSASPLEFVNGAISGATLEDQLEVLRIVGTQRVVKAVVLTTGVNDAHNRDFPSKLELVRSAVKKREAQLLLVPEPTELPLGNFIKVRHEELRSFAREHSIPLVDLPALLEQHADAGFLWWDFVHMSDGGAAIAAAALSAPLSDFLRSISPVSQVKKRKVK